MTPVKDLLKPVPLAVVITDHQKLLIAYVIKVSLRQVFLTVLFVPINVKLAKTQMLIVLLVEEIDLILLLVSVL